MTGQAPPSDERVPTIDVLREMHGAWSCSTDLCSGPSFGLQVKGDVVWATSECPCGSMDQHYPVPMADLFDITERALDALFGKCGECGEPCEPRHLGGDVR